MIPIKQNTSEKAHKRYLIKYRYEYWARYNVAPKHRRKDKEAVERSWEKGGKA